MDGKQLRLSDRLLAVAGFIEKGSNVADIGTDHGYLPVYLAQNGTARRIIASDLSAESLRSAFNAAVRYDVADKISFITAPGLSGVGESEADTVVLSGMGGETISGILEGAPWTKRRNVRIIMQPQTKIGKLCSWLRENGYALRDAKLTSEKGRLYVVILAAANTHDVISGEQRKEESGKMENGWAGMREFGNRNPESGISAEDAGDRGSADACHIPEIDLISLLADNGDPLFPAYIDELVSKTRRAAEGMARSNAFGYANMAKRLEALERLRSADRISNRKCNARRGVNNGNC